MMKITIVLIFILACSFLGTVDAGSPPVHKCVGSKECPPYCRSHGCSNGKCMNKKCHCFSCPG
uniref:Putative Potassium channel toxin n=1 Tax=Megacormus gertschi TaxID=1843536 RepID=A0A224X3K8_9SCOR